MLSTDIAIDFGSCATRVFLSGKGLVISEPAVVAVNSDSGQIVATGREAAQMLGRTAAGIRIERPFVGGVIVNYALAEHMVTAYIKRVGMGRLFLPGAVVSVPLNITEVEKHAISDIIERGGIRKINFVGEAVAAAMGAGVSVKSSVGSMVVDLGQATSAMAVIAANQVLEHRTLPVAGQAFDQALIRYLRKKRSLEVGPITAEALKNEVGSVLPREKVISMHVKGRNIYTGLPQEIVVTSDETVEALVDPATEIAKAVEDSLLLLPAEILGDIAASGILFTGGSAKLYGLAHFIGRRVKLPIKIAETPENAVINGAARALDLLDKAGSARSFVGLTMK